MTNFPATVTVHRSSGPVSACDEHATSMVKLADFMDSPVAVTVGATRECVNCRNEHDAKSRADEENRVPLDSTSSPSDMPGGGHGDG